MAVVSNDIQKELTDLKHLYLTKRNHVIDRLHNHQNTIEDFLKIFTDTIENYRNEVLREEYQRSQQMDDFENKMKSLLNKTQNYSAVEFYFEQYNIQKEIKQLKASIGTVSIYTPSIELKVSDLKDETKKIQEDLKAKLDSYMKPVDNSFALECFKYATEEMGNEQIARIYNLLGPFDYSQWRDEALEDEDRPLLSDEDEDKEERRMPQEQFEKRRSGAMYRGVPTMWPVWVSDSSFSFVFTDPPWKTLLNPQSMTWTSPWPPSMTLSGFRSRCTTPLACA